MTIHFRTCSAAILAIAVSLHQSPVSSQELKQRAVLSGHTFGVFSLAYSHDGKTLASGSQDKTIKLWDTTTNENTATLKGHSEPVWVLEFSPNNMSLASSADDDTVRHWTNFKTSQHSIAPGLVGSDHSSLAFTPDGKKIVFASVGKVYQWDFEKGGKKIILDTMHKFASAPVAFTSNGKLLAFAFEINPARAAIWDVKNGAFRTLKECKGGVLYAPFSHNGKLAVTGALKKAELWDCANGKLTVSVPLPGGATFVIFSPDDEIVAVAYKAEDGGHNGANILLFESATGKEIAKYQRNERYSTIIAMAFSPDGRTLAVGGQDNKIRLFDVPVFKKGKGKDQPGR